MLIFNPVLSHFVQCAGAVPAIIAFPWRLRMHETETFERVKQDRADAADKLSSQTQSDPIIVGTGNQQQTAQYGSTQTVDTAPTSSSGKFIGSSTRMDELKRTWHFYKYHMLGLYVHICPHRICINIVLFIISIILSFSSSLFCSLSIYRFICLITYYLNPFLSLYLYLYLPPSLSLFLFLSLFKSIKISLYLLHSLLLFDNRRYS